MLSLSTFMTAYYHSSSHHGSSSCREREVGWCGSLGSTVAQGDLVRLGDVVGLDCGESFAQTLASRPQELERAGGGAQGSGAGRIGPEVMKEVWQHDRRALVGGLGAAVESPHPRGPVTH